MNRFLIFHHHGYAGNQTRMAPSAYYMDAEHEKVAVRIYAEDAPLEDATFDIFDDGTSIFSNRTTRAVNATTGADITGVADTNAVLSKGKNSEEIADDFNNTVIAEGSWVYCNVMNGGGGKNFMVQLELAPLSEGETGED